MDRVAESVVQFFGRLRNNSLSGSFLGVGVASIEEEVPHCVGWETIHTVFGAELGGSPHVSWHDLDRRPIFRGGVEVWKV